MPIRPCPAARRAARPAPLPGAAAALLLAFLAACAPRGAPDAQAPPVGTRPVPAPKPAPEPEPGPHVPSAASLNMAAFLAGVEERLLARGRLRTDPGREIALDAEELAQIFAAVALRDEYSRENGRLVRRGSPAPLRRWDQPVRFQLDFGASVGPEQRRKDRAATAALAARLTRASGHPASLVGSGGNFILLVVDEDERRAMGPHLAALLPGIPQSDIDALTGLSPQIFCTVFTYSRSTSFRYAHAVAVIRAELGPRMRSSCLHEEMAQGLGLANDSPHARPSVFNDDEEFAHLTWLDEVLLGMLYDGRLQPGMTEAEAMPIIRAIAREYLPGAGS